MAVSDSTQLNDLVGQIVSAEAQSAAYAHRIMRNLVHSVAVPQGAGSIVIPRFAALDVAALSEGTAPSSTTWTTDGVTLTPTERGVYVQISKRALYADPFADLAPYGQQIGMALANDEDEQILTIGSGLATTIASGTYMASPKETFLSAIADLEAQNAPGPYFGVFHPAAWAYLRADIGDASVFGNPGRQVVEGFGEGITNLNGYVGSPYGVPCFITSKVETDWQGVTAYNIVASKEAIGYAYLQDLTVDVDNNVTARAFDLMGWYSGAKAELVDVYGVRIDCEI